MQRLVFSVVIQECWTSEHAPALQHGSTSESRQTGVLFKIHCAPGALRRDDQHEMSISANVGSTNNDNANAMWDGDHLKMSPWLQGIDDDVEANPEYRSLIHRARGGDEGSCGDVPYVRRIAQKTVTSRRVSTTHTY